MDEYRKNNRANWDDRAAAHAASPDYAVEHLAGDPGAVSGVVAFDRVRLGDLTGVRGVHLQCHIGTDTVSLARLGATMTGLDFSPASLVEARAIAARCGVAVEFVESDVYEALSALAPASFDLVYTGIGALCWLDDVVGWARVVAGLLRPGGRLFVRDGHPMLWSLDETETERLVVAYPYFEVAEPLTEDADATYVETDASFEHNVAHSWNHGLGEIIGALLGSGFSITALDEHDSVPWNALPGQMTRGADGEWRLTDRPERLAASYTLDARKR